MNRLVLHHTGSEEGWGDKLWKNKRSWNVFRFFFFPTNRMREAEQQRRPFIGLGIRNIIAADADIKDVLLAFKSAKNLECHIQSSQWVGCQEERHLFSLINKSKNKQCVGRLEGMTEQRTIEPGRKLNQVSH